MEISTRNGDYALERPTRLSDVEEDNPRGIKAQSKTKPPRPPVPELSECLVPAATSPTSCSNSPPQLFKTSEDISELLFHKLPDYLGTSERKAFLRPAEHILAKFYGVVFEIQGNDWNVLKSEYLPIYFVRVSVKNAKYPFRILVVDDDLHRAVDFIVNCDTKTRISEQAVCWEGQETFGVRFSSKQQAIQFYDTICRMTSTLRKGKALRDQNSDKMLELEVHLPNSEVKNYHVLKNDKLKNTLKFICGKEHLRANDHYFHYMQLADDSLDMNLRVGDIRTHIVKVVSKKDDRRSATDVLDKVSHSTPKKNGGICSYFRRRFARKPKNSRHYSSSPSVLQYNDNIFMVERQTEQKKSENKSRDDAVQSTNGHTRQRPSSSETTQLHSSEGKNLSTPSVRNVKRKAPPPPLILRQQNGEMIMNGDRETRKHTKRRAPSPPKDPKPCRPPRPASLSSRESNPTSPLDSQAATIAYQTTDTLESNRELPVFIPPPPPDTAPPPLEECETPVGPVDIDFDEDSVSVETPSETNDLVDETKLPEEKGSPSSTVTEGTEHSNEENLQNGASKEEESLTLKNKDKKGDNEKNGEKEMKEVIIEKDEKDDGTAGSSITKEQKETSIRTNNPDENVSDEELKLRESLKGLTPEQLQMLLKAQTSGNTGQTQQLPFNIQNQQYFAMHQRQQILYNLLIQQMIEQQMAQQTTATSMLSMNLPPVQPVANAAPPMQYVGGTVPHIHSVGGNVATMQPVGGNIHSMQYVGGNTSSMQSVGAVSPVQSVGVVPPVQSIGAVPPVQSVGAVPPVQSIGDVPPVQIVPGDVQSVSVDLDTEKSKVSVPPAKDEELVNRPLFKKMLAQVSQGKLNGIPKVSSGAEHVGTTSPSVSPNAKIEKIPSSYVESAGKNIPVTKVEEEKKSPVPLIHSGRKSSYVESAIDRSTVDESVPTQVKTKVDEKTMPVAFSHSITSSSKLEQATDRHQFVRTQENVKVIEKISSPTDVEEKKAPSTLSGDLSSYRDSAIDNRKTKALIPTPTDVEEKKAPSTLSGDLSSYRTTDNRKTKALIPAPTEVEEKKAPSTLTGDLSSYRDSAIDNRKTKALIPAPAEKPKYRRQLSEPAAILPKPVVGPKPTAVPVVKSKTLPKTKKSEPLKISLCLTEEERLMIPSFSGVGKTASDDRRNVVTTPNGQHDVVSSLNSVQSKFDASSHVHSKLNVVTQEEKQFSTVTSVKNVRGKYE